MSAIGRTHHLRCQHPECNKRRPYWSRFCKGHRAVNSAAQTQQQKQADTVAPTATVKE